MNIHELNDIVSSSGVMNGCILANGRSRLDGRGGVDGGNGSVEEGGDVDGRRGRRLGVVVDVDGRCGDSKRRGAAKSVSSMELREGDLTEADIEVGACTNIVTVVRVLRHG